jgi:enamine deaminase RidA (YjgF/YER057c/UK114 family)
VYSHAVKVGNIIFVAGQCPNAPSPSDPITYSEIVCKGDPYGQARLCYQNVKAALEAAGASMRDVVKINTYSTHPDLFKILIEVRKEFFEPPYPASTGVIVTSLYDPNAMFEVEVIAIVEPPPQK